MRRLLILACALLGPGSAARLAAQGSCEVISGPRTVVNEVGPATYISGRTRINCDDGVSFIADSMFSAYGRRLLIGNVEFSDPEKKVTSQRLDHDSRSGIVIATGATVVTDRQTGSVLNAPQGLQYTRESATTPAQLVVSSGRPHLTLYRDRTGGGRDTTDVDSNQMRLVGENVFYGFGDVVIRRGALNARGGQAEFDDEAGRMLLWQTAKIVGEDYTLDADSIHGDATGDEFRELRAFRNARLDSENLDVESGRLLINLDSGVVSRLVAVGPPGRDTLNGPRQAHAVTPDFDLTADSIDAHSPDQKLEQVIAIGTAYAVRAPDSLDLKLPELIRNDWLRGDTVHAFFVEAPDSIKARRAEQDSTAFDRVLDRLIAAGAGRPASAVIRIREEGDTTNQVQVNYISARRITTFFKDGAVRDVDAQEQIKGMYLQPIKRTAATEPPRRRP